MCSLCMRTDNYTLITQGHHGCIMLCSESMPQAPLFFLSQEAKVLGFSFIILSLCLLVASIRCSQASSYLGGMREAVLGLKVDLTLCLALYQLSYIPHLFALFHLETGP